MHNNSPEVGDVLEVKIEDITDDGCVVAGLAKGRRKIKIKDKTLNRNEYAYVKITREYYDHLKAEVAEPPEDNDDDSPVYTKRRDEEVEWKGTKQQITSTEERNKGFEDIRDNKNDLLDGPI